MAGSSPKGTMCIPPGNNFSNICAGGESVVSRCADTIQKALRDVINHQDFKPVGPITIADYGTADGSNFMPLLRELIGIIREKFGQWQEILVIFVDQPSNDFNLLNKNIHGACGLVKGIEQDGNIFMLTSGRDMYTQCLPNLSVDLIVSSMAVNWLSNLPCNISNAIHNCGANDEDYTRFKVQSARDWKTFLVNRGKELKPGGRMIIATLAKFPDGKLSEHLHGGFHSLTSILKDLLKNKIISQYKKLRLNKMNFAKCTCHQEYKASHLQQEEFENITSQEDVERSEQDFRYPFENGDSDIKDTCLILESLNFKESINKQGIDKNASKDLQTLETYAKNVVDNIKPWLYNVIYDGLNTKRPDEDRKYIVEMFFQRVFDFAKDQEDHPPCTVRFAEIVVKKLS